MHFHPLLKKHKTSSNLTTALSPKKADREGSGPYKASYHHQPKRLNPDNGHESQNRDGSHCQTGIQKDAYDAMAFMAHVHKIIQLKDHLDNC